MQITTGPFYENGYDVNQYRRPFDVEEGAFADGKRFDWVPQIQQQFWKVAQPTRVGIHAAMHRCFRVVHCCRVVASVCHAEGRLELLPQHPSAVCSVGPRLMLMRARACGV
eukprot:528211-Rhodomonas_salina.1